MSNFKNMDWEIKKGNLPNSVASVNEASLAVLMDIRDELQKLNSVFSCSNFVQIPQVLKDIRKNTNKRRKPIKPKRRRG